MLIITAFLDILIGTGSFILKIFGHKKSEPKISSLFKIFNVRED